MSGTAKPIQHRSRQDAGQFRAADAAELPGAHRRRLSQPCQRRLRGPRLHLVADLCALPAFCVVSRGPKHRPWRHGRGDAAEHPRDERGAFCGPDGRRRAQRAQHPARCRLHRLSARSWRRQDHPGRSGICRRDRRGADPDEGAKAICHRCRRCGFRGRQAHRRDRIRGRAVAGRSGFCRTVAAGRMGRHRAQLHLGHHGQSQGRGDPSPRRLPQRRQQHPRRQSRPASGLSLDPADVPLQRLVLSVDHRGDGGHQRLPAQGRSRPRFSS